MAIQRSFNGIQIIEPGTYTKIIVENLTGFPLQPTGFVGIIGEALGGAPRILDILEKGEIQSAKERYKSGEIADALDLVANGSNDPRIVNGASKIVVYKVNNSTQSSLLLKNLASATIVTLKSKNFGADENNMTAVYSEGAIKDEEAQLVGSVAGPYTLAGTETLILRANNVVHTYTSTLGAGSFSATVVAADMDAGGNWAPSKPVIATVDTVSGNVKIVLDPAVVTGGELDYGYLEIDAASTIDTILGITGEDRGQKGSRFLTLEKSGTTEISLELGGVNALSIQYTGAAVACTLDIQIVSGELKLTTSATATPADDLDIVLEDSTGKNKFTLKELVALIDANAAYSATVQFPNEDQNANELDYYLGVIINDVALSLRRDIFDTVDIINTFSALAVAERTDNAIRAIETFSTATLFTGATDGAALTNLDWSNGFDAFKEERLNIVVPLISADKGAVSIDSVNTLADGHARTMAATDGKSERNVYVSKTGTKDELKSAAQALNSQFTSIVGQDVRVLDRFGELNFQDPWALACLGASMQAGSEVGEPITKKFINANDIRVRDGSWTPRQNVNEMIEAGVTFAEKLDTGGIRWIVGNTTYNKDGNFVFNRISVLESAHFVAFDLRFNLDLVFIGTKARTGTAEAIANFIRNRMAIFLEADITVGDDLNDGLGFKDLRVVIEGNTALVNISITPVQGIDFILPTIFLSDIRQSA